MKCCDRLFKKTKSEVWGWGIPTTMQWVEEIRGVNYFTNIRHRICFNNIKIAKVCQHGTMKILGGFTFCQKCEFYKVHLICSAYNISIDGNGPHSPRNRVGAIRQLHCWKAIAACLHPQNGMVQGQWSMVHWAWCMMVHGACCKGHGAWKHGACAGWHHAMARIHGSQGMLYHSMVHASMKHRTFSPLFTVSEITDALCASDFVDMSLISEEFWF